MSIRATISGLARARLAEAPSRWLDDAVSRAASGTLDDLLLAYTAASPHLGHAALIEAPGAQAPFPFAHWTLEDAGRLLMLLARAGVPAHGKTFAADAAACYEQGDAREQRSWLRGVAFLPDPAQYLPIVVDACRTNILPVFEAVACENAYPGDHFPERSFNQLVLKALFNAVPLSRIAGLERRVNPELARMAADYADERRAAGRPVPADISLALAGGATS